MVRGIIGLFILGFVAVWLFSGESTASKAEAKAKEAECREDLQCWAHKHRIDADIACSPQIERLARYTTEWTDGFSAGPKFARYRWKNKAAGQVTYIGDRIKFQNGFGAWQDHMYMCDYDPTTKSASGIVAAPGRL